MPLGIWNRTHTYIPTFQDKAVLEPRVSPAFASTYFCNHCNIRFENTSKYVDILILFFQKLEPKVIDPYITFDPMSVEVTCVTLPKDHCVQVPWQYINVCGYSDQFGKLPHTYTCTHTYIKYYIQNEWSHSLLLNSVQARQKSDPFIYQPTRFWSKFWQSYLPPFFFIYCFFVFQIFLDLSQFWLKLQKKLKNRLIHIQNFA